MAIWQQIIITHTNFFVNHHFALNINELTFLVYYTNIRFKIYS